MQCEPDREPDKEGPRPYRSVLAELFEGASVYPACVIAVFWVDAPSRSVDSNSDIEIRQILKIFGDEGIGGDSGQLEQPSVL